eukprot:g1029.t1
MAEISSGATHMKVFCRFRPENRSEAGAGICHRISRQVTRKGEDIHLVELQDGQAATGASVLVDGAFDQDSSQLDVYEAVGQPLLSRLLQGYNGAVMSYGQTGSGKTYTMLGDTDMLREAASYADWDMTKAGVIPYVAASLFDQLAVYGDRGSRIRARVRCSFVQIYKEKVFDLLVPSVSRTGNRDPPVWRCSHCRFVNDKSRDGAAFCGNGKCRQRRDLKVRLSQQFPGEFVPQDAAWVTVDSADGVLACVAAGAAQRVTASTRRNDESSRSHAIFALELILKDTAAGTSRRSVMHMVDLAGSERYQHLSGAAGAAGAASVVDPAETRNINLSLMALKGCIGALAEKRRHVPFRDSTLTQLLAHCIGGRSATTHLLVHASPSLLRASETRDTLSFAARARTILNDHGAGFGRGGGAPAFRHRTVDEVRAALSAATATQSAQAMDLRALRRTVERLRGRAGELLRTVDPSSSAYRSLLGRFPLLRTLGHKTQAFRWVPSFLFLDIVSLCGGESVARARAVSKSWDKEMANPGLWQHLCRVEFGINNSSGSSGTSSSSGGGGGSGGSGGDDGDGGGGGGAGEGNSGEGGSRGVADIDADSHHSAAESKEGNVGDGGEGGGDNGDDNGDGEGRPGRGGSSGASSPPRRAPMSHYARYVDQFRREAAKRKAELAKRPSLFGGGAVGRGGVRLFGNSSQQ